MFCTNFQILFECFEQSDLSDATGESSSSAVDSIGVVPRGQHAGVRVKVFREVGRTKYLVAQLDDENVQFQIDRVNFEIEYARASFVFEKNTFLKFQSI